jgi:hypothetical protein
MTESDLSSLKIYSRRNFAEEILIVDGITRSGKFMLSRVLSAFSGVEFVQYPFLLENLPYLVRYGMLPLETCRILMQTDLDYAAFNMAIGRGLNGRRSDITWAGHALEAEALLARAEREDESALVGEFRDARRLPLFFCHEGLCHIGLILDCLPGAKVVEILRDPASIALSWFKKGYGRRWGSDPKVVSIAFETQYGVVPWFAAGVARDYAVAGEMERVVLCLSEIMRMARDAWEGLDPAARARVRFVSFESVLADPEPILSALERFTGKTRHPRIGEALRRERLPRAGASGAAEAAVAEVKAGLSPRYAALLDRCRTELRDYWLPLT